MASYVQFDEGLVIRTDHPEFHADANHLAKKEGEKIYLQQAVSDLRNLIKSGETVYTVLRHVSQSGMSRNIDLFVIRKNQLRCITHDVGTLLDMKQARNGGLTVSGCGMDMGYHIVYALGSAIWPKGTRKAHSTRNGKPDHDGGYALNHKWI